MRLKGIFPKALLFMGSILFSYILICFYLSSSAIQKADSDSVYKSIVIGVIGEDVDLKFQYPISVNLVLIKQPPLDGYSLYMMPFVIDDIEKKSLEMISDEVTNLNVLGLYIQNFNG